MVRNLEKLGGQTPRFGGSSIQLKNIFPKKTTKFQLCFAPHKYYLPNISSLTMLGIFLIFTTRKRSLGQGNMFTGVCLSTGGVSGPGGGAWSPGCLVETPPQRLLLRAVRILLECILVHLIFIPLMYILAQAMTNLVYKECKGRRKYFSIHDYPFKRCLRIGNYINMKFF